MRVVLDTNVVMSAIFFGGTPRKIVRAAFSKKVDLVASNPTFHVRNESPRFARAFVRFLELSNKGLHYTPADAVCAASELTFGGGCAGSVSPSWFKRILTSSFGST